MTIPAAFLASISSGCDRIPSLYFESNFLLRHYFWQRLRTIFRHILRDAAQRRRCLDFGGGGGVFLPTISGAFDEVTLVDLVTAEARKVVREFKLLNVTLLQQDVRDGTLGRFDVVVAADVLEHFEDPDPAIRILRDAVSDGGVLVTSLPTENLFYRALRWVFRVEKPDDHYHTAHEVEHRLATRFRRVRTTRIPSPLAPLFVVTTWRPR